MNELLQIKDSVQQFAEAASAALNFDIEICDKSQRIAGTGWLKPKIGERVFNDGLIGRILFSGTKKLIVKDPGLDELCIPCRNYGRCNYKAAVYSAIEYKGFIIGAIGISTDVDEHVKLIEYNNYAMLEFLERIGNLISSKVEEYSLIKEIETKAESMNTMINNINKGVLVLDKDFSITEFNYFLIEKLKIDNKEILNRNILEVFPSLSLFKEDGSMVDKAFQEISYIVEGKQIFLLCTLKPILVNKKVEGIICLIEDYKDTTELAYALSSKQNEIKLKDIIGMDINFLKFKEKVKNVAINDSTVLLTGETGTGKELFARAVHSESRRTNKPFIIINCGAIPEPLIESELFGYEKGAFTGASKTGKHGKFYMANKGTLFLDEVENMPLYLQQKLLRVIENREIERIGAVKSIPLNVRVVAATNVRLDEMVRKGEFREDLFHRLNVVTLFIPPLRERKTDILILSNYFIEKFNKRFNKDILGLSAEVKDIFLSYFWDGNVRELQNAIEYAINMEKSQYIKKENLPYQFRENKLNARINTLEEIEKEYIKNALDKFGWSQNGIMEAAKQLGISRATIYRKIKKYKFEQMQSQTEN